MPNNGFQTNFESDTEAVNFLEAAGFQVSSQHTGLIYYPSPRRALSEKELDAIDYLFLEWDYGFKQPIIKGIL